MSVTLSHFSTCALHVTHLNICCHSPCRNSRRTSYSLSSRALLCNFRVTLLKCYCLFCFAFLSFLAFFTLTPNDDFAIGPFFSSGKSVGRMSICCYSSHALHFCRTHARRHSLTFDAFVCLFLFYLPKSQHSRLAEHISRQELRMTFSSLRHVS